jgi:hypothetical protein
MQGAGILLATIVVTVAVLAAAVTWGPHHCKSAFPMVIGCAIGSYESLTGGIIAAGAALFAGWLAWSAVQIQIKLSNPPRLIVRQFQVELPVVLGQPIKVSFAIINVGHTDALPNLLACEVALWNGKYFEAPGLDPVQKKINLPPVRRGQRAHLHSQSRFDVTQQQLDDILKGALSIQVLGEITYRDELNTQRRTGFRRAYDCNADKFIPSTNVDEEYCD